MDWKWERSQYPAFLTKQTWSIVYGLWIHTLYTLYMYIEHYFLELNSRLYWESKIKHHHNLTTRTRFGSYCPLLNCARYSNSALSYMASSASGQDEPNRALWLATRAGKMEPYCLLETTRCILQAKFPQNPYNKSFIEQVCLVKMAGYWPRSFFASLFVSVHKHAEKELGQYPAILTSHLVNNPYRLYG